MYSVLNYYEAIKILGYIITYKPKDSYSRTIINHSLFGRIVHRNYRGKKYAYYSAGMLHNTHFARLVNSRIFVSSLDDIDTELLEKYGIIEVETCNRDDNIINLLTGEEHWQSVALERNLNLRVMKKNGKKQ